jgi:hypothetical protein
MSKGLPQALGSQTIKFDSTNLKVFIILEKIEAKSLPPSFQRWTI